MARPLSITSSDLGYVEIDGQRHELKGDCYRLNLALSRISEQPTATVSEVAAADTGNPAWLSLPALQNGWTADNVTFYGTPGYYKGSDGWVHIRGEIKAGTITDGTLLLTMPAGYRPAFWYFKPMVTFTGLVYSTCALIVETDGKIFLYGAGVGTLDIHINFDFPTF